MMMANNDDIFYSDDELSDSDLYQVNVKLFIKRRSSQFLLPRRAPISGHDFSPVIPRAYSAANCGQPLVSQCPRTMFPTRFITRSIGQY